MQVYWYVWICFSVAHWNSFIKNCVLILTCLNFSHLHLMQYTYWAFFFTAQNSFWTHWFRGRLVLLPFCLFVCFPSFTVAKHFPLRSFFIWGNKKILLLGVRSGESGRWETGVRLFLAKNCWTLSTVWALVNHPSRNGQTHWKSLQKKFTEAKHSLSQQCQLVHWYIWVPRTLT